MLTSDGTKVDILSLIAVVIATFDHIAQLADGVRAIQALRCQQTHCQFSRLSRKCRPSY